ncbi:MAG: twin-arginine translocation signal domain-containing protein, partial [Thermoleophilaceae bacterium]|nr:twin-arginine translocation signal domain-containing protein [Thermoleophilaceae bacterium]
MIRAVIRRRQFIKGGVAAGAALTFGPAF